MPDSKPHEKTVATLAFRAALFDTHASLELSKRVSPHFLWSLKLSVTSFYVGFMYGGYKTFIPSLYQFDVENMHRRPTTKAGYYEYYKQRNYRVTKAVIKNGLKYACKSSLSTSIYTLLEYGFMKYGGFENSIIECTGAAFVTTTIYSVFNKFKFRQIRQMMLLGGGSGLCIGVIQEFYKEFYGVSIKQFT